jgi:hypothetical protein
MRSFIAASTMTKFFLPVRLTYSTRVTRAPALPDEEAAGLEQDLASPSGCSRGTKVSRVGGRRQDALGLGPDFHQAGSPLAKGILVDDADAAADAEEVEAVLAAQSLDERRDLLDRLAERASPR